MCSFTLSSIHTVSKRQQMEGAYTVKERCMKNLIQSREKIVTVSYLKPVLSLFNTEVLAVKSEDTDLAKTIKETIRGYLNAKYKDDIDLLSLASTLDARFKSHYNDDDQVEAVSSKITTELLAMETEEDHVSPGPSTSTAQDTTAEDVARGDDTREPPKKAKK
ncbi:hypothetical protein GOODEAATRI_010034 [Goodea atripinnis]|uniref:Uncharacterized protein n=1 Tax=Goodea atripinnis TaxID=208336 RepID=A0ABV0NV08_9TELE